MHDELHKRVQRLIRERSMTLRAAETVVMAAMHSVGCVESLIDLLPYYRRVMDHIHTGGSIFYDKGRMAAYIVIAKLASEERKTSCT